MRSLCVAVLLASITGVAAADPDPAISTDPDPPGALFNQQPLLRPPNLGITNNVPSLRLEALRVIGERQDQDWRYPEPGTLGGVDGHGFFMGYGHYRPRTKRSAVLHGTSIGATILGEILLQSGTPLAGIGVLAGAATLDAAAADVDRDAEARRPQR